MTCGNASKYVAVRNASKDASVSTASTDVLKNTFVRNTWHDMSHLKMCLYKMRLHMSLNAIKTCL
jgi:hypothetical protein